MRPCWHVPRDTRALTSASSRKLTNIYGLVLEVVGQIARIYSIDTEDNRGFLLTLEAELVLTVELRNLSQKLSNGKSKAI